MVEKIERMIPAFANADDAPSSAAGGAQEGGGETYSIGQLAAATGISTHTLRAWERRYGQPRCERLASGHRRYAREQEVWLRRVAEALAAGHRPGAVLPLDAAQLERLLAGCAQRGTPPRPVAQWLELTTHYDEVALAQELRRESRTANVLDFLEDLLVPFLRTVGCGWADGRVCIRHEHFATQIVASFLREWRERFAGAWTAAPPRLLIAGAPGERHELTLSMIALVCAARGVSHRTLGTDTPLAEIAAAAREVGAQAVATSISLANGGVDTDRRVADLRDALSAGCRLLVGGAGARRGRRGPRAVVYLESLRTFDQWIARNLTTAPRAAGGRRKTGPPEGHE